MPARGFPLIILVAVIFLLAITSMFSVAEQQAAIRTQFGAIIGEGYSPGLHAKWPWDQVI
jgi:regulator of protease activity HflC (stomatin/prohibitin superfamily)